MDEKEEEGGRPSLVTKYHGWNKSRDVIRAAVVEHGPIDVMLGFSQGATAAALYLAEESGDRNSRIQRVELTNDSEYGDCGDANDDDNDDNHRRRPSAILVSGFLPRDEGLANVLRASSPMDLRSIHVSGKNDQLVTTDRSQELWRQFASPDVYLHEGAHMVPTCTGEWKRVLTAFVDSLQSLP